MSTQKSSQIVVLTQQERVTLDSKREVTLLLKSLAEREGATVKLILDRLYELGALNIINNKIRSRSLKLVVKRLAKLSKPAFRAIGFYWFKRNCPQLITNWLLTQVAFENTENNLKDVTEVANNSLEVAALADLKIKQLNSKVRLLTNILVMVILIGVGSFAWLFYTFKVQQNSIDRSTGLANTCLEK